MLNAKQINRLAIRCKRKLKGRTDFVSVEEYLNDVGYKVIFFNTNAGDTELARYCLTEKAQNTNAFTYCGTAKIIFINNNISPEDKVYSLYHEMGHIMLGHLECRRIGTTNKILLDIQADAFSCGLL